jgi:hypothetical protein
MGGLAVLAKVAAENREPLPVDHPFLQAERDILAAISAAIARLTNDRDGMQEQAFRALYGL